MLSTWPKLQYKKKLNKTKQNIDGRSFGNYSYRDLYEYPSSFACKFRYSDLFFFFYYYCFCWCRLFVLMCFIISDWKPISSVNKYRLWATHLNYVVLSRMCSQQRGKKKIATEVSVDITNRTFFVCWSGFCCRRCNCCLLLLFLFCSDDRRQTTYFWSN